MEISKVLVKLGELGYEPIGNLMQPYQEIYKAWYQGYVEGFHDYVNYQGIAKAEQKIKRYTAGMWKDISELWADNMWNPETKVVITHDATQEWWDKKSREIKFSTNFNDLQELTFAMGTTATNEYINHMGKVDIDYLTYDVIVPLEVVNKDIVSVAFVSQYTEDVLYVNIHDRQDDGTYIIYNQFYKVVNGNIDMQLDLGVLGNPSITEEYRSPVKLFQIHTPAIVNNKVSNSPFGISVLGNSIDVVKGVDLAYNALTKESEFGKIRVYLQSGALNVDIDGEKATTFNQNQEEFYLLKGDDMNDKGELVTVSAPVLRQVLIDFLNAQLNMLGRKVGLGDNAFSFQDGTIYTNTAAIVSTNSKFFKTRQKHGELMKSNVIDIVKALYWLEFGKILEHPISVQMDDSIVHDEEKEINRLLQLKNMGLPISDDYIIQKVLNFDETQAKAFVEEQRALIGNLDEDVEDEGGE